MPITVESVDGKQGTFDPVEFLRSTVGQDISVKSIDIPNNQISFESGGKQGTFNPVEYLQAQGVKTTGISDSVNSPETAVDQSPLSFMDRAKLGLLSRESEDNKRLLSVLGNILGMGGESSQALDEQQTVANKSRILAALSEKVPAQGGDVKKYNFDDVKFVNGEPMLKKDGVWYKSDSPGLDKGDIAQFFGQAGLNIAGSVAGGELGLLAGAPAGPIGSTIGAIIGAGAGAFVTQGAEELMAAGISDGKIDPDAALKDMASAFIFNALGEGAGQWLKTSGLLKAASKGKLSEEAASAITKTIETDVADKTISGMQTVAKNAAPEVKDFIANAMSTLNSEVSAPVLRTAIDNPENMAKVAKNIEIMKNVPQDTINPLDTKMQKVFQDGMDKATKMFNDAYRPLEDAVRSTIAKSPSYTADLKEIKAAFTEMQQNVASQTGRNEFQTVLNAIDIASKGGKVKELNGAEAFDFFKNLDVALDDAAKKAGIFNLRKSKNAADFALTQGYQLASDFLNGPEGKLTTAYKWANLAGKEELLGNLYRETRPGMNLLRNKFYAETNKAKFLGDVARGQNQDFIAAFQNLDKAMQGINEIMGRDVAKFDSQDMLKELRLLQGGKELAPLVSNFKGKDLPQIATSMLVSPRGALKLGYYGARAADAAASVGNAVRMPIDAAREQARRIMTVAQASGMLSKLNPADKLDLLKDPVAYQTIFNSIGQLANEQIGQNARVLNAAAQRAQQPPDRQPAGGK